MLKKSVLVSVLACTIGLLSAQDGSIDPTFNPGDIGFGQGDGANAFVMDMLIQPDGKAVICGSFTTCNAQSRNRIARLNSDASPDGTFIVGTGANNNVHALAIQPDGEILIGGDFTLYNGTARNRIARLNTDGSLDPLSAGTGPNNSVNAVAVQPDGKILLCGQFTQYAGVTRNGIVRMNTNGSNDATFNPGAGANSFVTAMLLQPDGKILIGGSFTSYNGTAINRIARLNSDGTLDASFNPGTGVDNTIRAFARQSDGKILVGGGFSMYNGTPRNCIARLNADGSLDGSFDPGTGANDMVWRLALQPDDKVICGGWFTTFDGNPHGRIVRLETNGDVDASFDPGTGTNDQIRALAFQADGRVLIGGDFNECNGTLRTRLARLNTDGGLDGSYGYLTGANNLVLHVAMQPDGKILCGGGFYSYDQNPCGRIIRLNSDGELDPSFNAGTGANGGVYSTSLQPDGKIVVGGTFTAINGIARKNVARLNADGSLDASFDPGTGPDYWPNNSLVLATALQPDGKVLVVGAFTSFNGAPRSRIARLNADGSVDGTFSPGTGATDYIWSVAIQPDGKILIGGTFTSYNGTVRNAIARLNADGSLDGSFLPGTGTLDLSFTFPIYSISLQPDGRIIIGGSFTKYNGVSRYMVARLNTDGSLDTGFNYVTGGASSTVNWTGVLPDGKVLIGGSFSTYNGVSRKYIARVNANGSLDTTFDPGTGASGQVRSCAAQADGKIIIGGDFTSYNGTGRNRIARINGTARTGIRVMLEGPFNGSTMNDALRILPSFPLTEPFTAMGYAHPTFTAGTTIPSSILTTTGNNAIIDWVLVEMRPAASPGTVAASRAVLLQRDGDVVDLDGVTTVGFAGLADGNYCVAVRSRNHLPVMSSPSTPVAYGDAIANIDFTLPATLVYDADARKNVSGVMVLWAGDVTFNGTVSYIGTGNDRDPILLRVGGGTPTNTASGYWREDANLDGVVKYTGAANDRDLILQSIGGTVPTNTRVAGLP